MPAEIDIPAGCRRPTPEEQAWIKASWEEEINELPSGKGVTSAATIFGTILTAIGASYLVREPRQVASAVIVLLVATAVLFFARYGKNDAKQNQRLLDAVTQGDYLVAEAVPTKIWFQKTKWKTMPWANVGAEGKQYRLPQSDTAALQQLQRPTVLLLSIRDCAKKIAVRKI